METTAAGPGSVEVRPAKEEDLGLVVEQIWQVAAEGRWLGTEVPFDREARRAGFATSLANESTALLVACAPGPDGETVIGHIWISLAPYGVADLGMLVVEVWRGRGVGKLLLDEAIGWAASAGAHKLALEVWPHNEAAIALYRSAGFVEEGRKVRHYRRRNGELWDSVLMGRPLAGPSQLGPARPAPSG
jgi:ribosomal protein S18 acetylase RimI-like enzyme